MAVIILTSGRPTNQAWHKKPPLSHELHTNKSLLEIKDGYTFLDSQMDILLKNGLNDVYIVVGYQADEVKQFCKERSYNVKLINDLNWLSGAYSSARTLWEIKDILLCMPKPIITLYNDIIFDQKTLDELLRCNCDVCCIQNSQNIIKWSQKGIEELIRILDEKEEYRFNWDGLSYPVWGKLRWNKNITWYTMQGGRLLNINTDDQYNRLRGR